MLESAVSYWNYRCIIDFASVFLFLGVVLSNIRPIGKFLSDLAAIYCCARKKA